MDKASFRDKSRPKPANPDSERGFPINPRRKFRRRGTGDNPPIKLAATTSEDEDIMMSDSSDHELDAFESGDDVEAGLPSEERRKFLRKQRKQKNIDSRIAGVANRLTDQEKKEADKNVVRTILMNTILIGLWYFFSLSISLVSLPSQ